MHHRPHASIPILCHFAACSSRVWNRASVLLIGAILSPGIRTVTAAVRVLGRSSETHLQNYHCVLNRATWSRHTLSRILLRLAVRQAAGCLKRMATFADTLAFVRQQRWPVSISWLARAEPDVVIIPMHSAIA